MHAEYKLRLQFSFYVCSKLFSAYINVYKLSVKRASTIILHFFPEKVGMKLKKPRYYIIYQY